VIDAHFHAWRPARELRGILPWMRHLPDAPEREAVFGGNARRICRLPQTV